MSLISRLRKVWSRRSKGMSTVVGAVFMILIIFTVSTSYVVMSMKRSAEYNQEAMERYRQEAERLNEEIEATNGDYTVLSASKINVEAMLENVGSVATEIVSLWVFDNTTQAYACNSTLESLDLNLNPGNSVQASINVTIPNIDDTHEFHSWLITSRGNMFRVKTADDILRELIAQGAVGPMIYSFYEFRYYLYQGSKLKDYPTGIENFEVPNNADIAFGVTIANYDAKERDMTLTSYTHLWVSSDSASMNQWKRFYIVDVAPDGTPSAYTSLTIPYGEKELLVLASGERGDFEKQSLPKSHFPDGTVQGTYLLIYGFFEGDSFAQNVPFVAFFMT